MVNILYTKIGPIVPETSYFFRPLSDFFPFLSLNREDAVFSKHLNFHFYLTTYTAEYSNINSYFIYFRNLHNESFSTYNFSSLSLDIIRHSLLEGFKFSKNYLFNPKVHQQLRIEYFELF